jgi:deoxyribose-phosphate aldolase
MSMNLDLSELLARADEYDRQLPELLLPDGHPGNRPIASWIDHTLLKPEATPQQVAQLCEEARRYAFASVCVNPVYVPLAHELLAGSPIMVCRVVGIPMVATLAASKA